MYNQLIIDNADKGIAIMADEHGNFSAYVNGKHYSVNTYRPLNGDGRQLRDDSQSVIRAMLPVAQERYAKMEAKRQERLDEIRQQAIELARQESTPAPKSFADALQDAFLQTLTEKAAGDMTEQIYPAVEKMLVEKFGLIPQVHEIHVPDRPAIETTEVLHKDFDRILSMMIDNESVYLCGPAGTGKSYLAQQVANALNLEYYYTNSVTDDVQIKGFVDANGRYHETQFYNAFVNGGVFLLDELDGSIPETLVLLNNALANGYFSFPNGKAKAHKDFHCIAAGNTFGTGADNQYTGRYQLDASSMDRFALIMVDYDERIEKAMCNNDAELVEFAHDFRRAVNECGISCLCTYRAIKRLHKFSAYMDKPDAIRIALTKGLPADDCQMIYNKLNNTRGEWAKALKAVSDL